MGDIAAMLLDWNERTRTQDTGNVRRTQRYRLVQLGTQGLALAEQHRDLGPENSHLCL
jgi:hypothetical protein